MGRECRIQLVSLRSSLVNLPLSIYGPLLDKSIRPQHLAVLLSSSSSSAYVGWTGLAAVRTDDTGLETIEIDPQYAATLGFKQGDHVEVGLLYDLPTASAVQAEPISSDDWDILELHADHVQNTLLSQVRVAAVGQEVNVWVLGRTRVRLRILSLTPLNKRAALLLTTNTELSIAPKPHPKPSPASASALTPTSSLPLHVLRVLSPHIHPLPAPFPASLPFAFTSDYTYAALTATPPPFPHPRTPASLPSSSLQFRRAVLSRMRPPPEVLDALAEHETAAEAPRGQGTRPTFDLWIAPLAGVPDDHLVFASPTHAGDNGGSNDANTARIPLDGVFEYDLVEIQATTTCEAFTFPVVDSDPTTLASSSTSATLHPPFPSLPELAAAHGLAARNQLLTRITAFFLHELALHARVEVIRGASALLLTGRQGTGKTSIARAVAAALSADPRALTYTLYVDLAPLASRPPHALISLFKHWYDRAAWHRPALVVLDNLDKVVAVDVEHAPSPHLAALASALARTFGRTARPGAPNARGVLLLATAAHPTALHPLLRGAAHVFAETLSVDAPSREERREMLSFIVQEHLARSPHLCVAAPSSVSAASTSVTTANSSSGSVPAPAPTPTSPSSAAAPRVIPPGIDGINYTALATQTEGYAPADLRALVKGAVHCAAVRVVAAKGKEKQQTVSKVGDESAEQPLELTHTDFVAAQADFVPLALREVGVQTSDVVWADIGGLKDVRRVLRETLEWPTKYGPIFAQSPLRLRSGLMLYGFPGCGKTLLASAVAKECGLNFISVKGPELLNKYIGASEKSVRDLFERAAAAKPCVLFFDEFDSIAPKRGHDSTGVTDRVVNQMLTQMDGAEGLEGVYVLAATSRPDLIDSALLRPGRLDKSLFCDLPNEEDREDILRAVSRKVPLAPATDLAAIATATAGFSGADLQALVYNAHLEVVHASIAPSSSATAVLEASKEDGGGRGKGKGKARADADADVGAGMGTGTEVVSESEAEAKSEEQGVEYTTFGGPPSTNAVASRAEEAALRKRLRQIKVTTKNQARGEGAQEGRAAEGAEQPAKLEITDEHLRRVLRSTRASVSPEERERLARIYRTFVSDRSGGMPVPPDAGGVGNRVSLM